MSLFELGYQYIVFLSFEVQFEKILERENKMSIISSYRNEYWIIPTNLNQENLLLIVDELLNGFSRSLMIDCETIELRVESGINDQSTMKKLAFNRSTKAGIDCSSKNFFFMFKAGLSQRF